MDACSYPGCVVMAHPGHRECPVHEHPRGGETCVSCRGYGYISMRSGRQPCDRCGGVGLKDKSKAKPSIKRGTDPVDQRGLIVSSGEPE